MRPRPGRGPRSGVGPARALTCWLVLLLAGTFAVPEPAEAAPRAAGRTKKSRTKKKKPAPRPAPEGEAPPATPPAAEPEEPETEAESTADPEETEEDPAAPPAEPAADAGDTSGHAPKGGRRLRAVRIPSAPVVDGRLDDAVWADVPENSSFLSRFKPGMPPTSEPTSVKVAYDETFLYVGMHGQYSPGNVIDSAVPTSELDASMFSEFMMVVVDPQHDHANAFSFFLTPNGFRGDVAISTIVDSGGSAGYQNIHADYDWTGYWLGRASKGASEWWAEFAIPWGTVGLVPRDGEFTVGINFRRKVFLINSQEEEASTWGFMEPSDWRSRPSDLGHLTGLSGVKPRQRLFLSPSVSVAAALPGVSRPLLRSFVGTADGTVAAFAGLEGWFRPQNGLALDFTFNPDFSRAPPDSARTQLNQFAEVYPEVRSFFIQGKQLFTFGPSDRFQLLFSRRLGLKGAGSTGQIGVEEVPILAGLRGTYRNNLGTQLGLLSVTTTGDRTDPSFIAESVNTLRLRQSIFTNSEIGAIAINQSAPGQLSGYRAYGLDGQVSVLEGVFNLRGFLARSDRAGAPSGLTGFSEFFLQSRSITANLSYLAIGDDFAAPYGYFEQTGVHELEAKARLSRFLENEGLLHRVDLQGRFLRRSTSDDALVIDQKELELEVTFKSPRVFNLRYINAREVVLQPFTRGRLSVEAGTYDSQRAELLVFVRPLRWLDVTAVYGEGTSYGNYVRQPELRLAARLPLFNLAVTYGHDIISTPAGFLNADRLSSRLFFVSEPYVNASFIAELNTLTQQTRFQLLGQLKLTPLSALSLTLNSAYDRLTAAGPSYSAILSFNYGLIPF